MIPLLLASLALAMPVSCAPALRDVAASYIPRSSGGPAVVVREPYCESVRSGRIEGAWLLGHELGHAWQDSLRLPFDEDEADVLAGRWERWLWLRLGSAPSVGLVG